MDDFIFLRNDKILDWSESKEYADDIESESQTEL